MAFKSLKILTTGSRGGFGNFIAKELNTYTFDRNLVWDSLFGCHYAKLFA